ncbi:tRNA-dependent cyclodipeptide synthase [Staphylococcus pseudintermedius]|uniref:tRNA-dependent cyclodipeptide synthase n=1 Tax=Staphylococcus pseudintermedius TaxID=283734 RepID=UPI00286937AC|nr:tRNA-dependent cyclodipeptide synthase [Staphylococcus pseudintermedius]
MRKLIKWANTNFKDFYILLDGEESKKLLECIGYSNTKANRKVRKEVNRKIRVCENELLNCNRTINDRILRFSDLKQNN